MLVAKKFTNNSTADGMLDAYHLTIGCISLALVQLNEEIRLAQLISLGAEQLFQSGFRLIRELASLPCQSIVTSFDSEAHVQQRNLKALFLELCRVDLSESWIQDETFRRELASRRENQELVDCAKWLRRQHYAGVIKEGDLDANAVVALSVLFAILNDGRIVARTGQKDIENLIRTARAKSCDPELGWLALLQKTPDEFKFILRTRMDEYKGGIVKKILSKTAIKTVVTEIQNYHAGIEQDVDYD